MVLVLPLVTSMYVGENEIRHDMFNNFNNFNNNINNNNTTTTTTIITNNQHQNQNINHNNGDDQELQNGNILTTTPITSLTTTTTTTMLNGTETTIPSDTNMNTNMNTNGTSQDPNVNPPEEARDCVGPDRAEDDKTPARHLSTHDSDLSCCSSSSSCSDSDAMVTNHHSLPYPEELKERSNANNSSANYNNQSANKDKILMTIAGVAGNVLEWYDFAVFGYFADIIGDNFFPKQDGNSQLMDSFIVFGAAFLMRPCKLCRYSSLSIDYSNWQTCQTNN